MGNLRPFMPQGNSVVSTYLDSVRKQVNQHNLNAGKNVKIEQSSGGKKISVDIPVYPGTLRMQGMYDINAEYQPYDVVVVPSTGSYYDYQGNLIPFNGQTSPYTGSYINPGTYVCNVYVPPSSSNASIFLNDVVQSYNNSGITPNDLIANTFRWDFINTYYPTTNSLVTTNTGSFVPTTILSNGYNIFNNLNYWQELSAAPNSNPATGSFTGDWDPNRTYQYQQIAAISYGPNSGLYYYINQTPSSGNPPWAGSGFWYAAPNNPLGAWA